MKVTLSSYLAGRDSDTCQTLRLPMFLFQDELFADLSTDAKFLYGLMLNHLSNVEKNGGVDEKGNVYIYFPVGEVQAQLHCSRPKAIAMITELEKYEMIRKFQPGRGKPTRFYVMDCFKYMRSEPERSSDKEKMTASPAFSQNTDRKSQDWASRPLVLTGEMQSSRSEDGGSTSSRYVEHREKEVHAADWTMQYSESVNTASNTPSFEECVKKVHEQLEYDLLIERNPMHTRLIDDICDLIVETMLSRRDTIRCAGGDIPTQIVQQRLLRLDCTDIERVIQGIREAGTAGKVRNPKNYLLTVLFNEPVTSDTQYMMNVNSDLAGVS